MCGEITVDSSRCLDLRYYSVRRLNAKPTRWVGYQLGVRGGQIARRPHICRSAFRVPCITVTPLSTTSAPTSPPAFPSPRGEKPDIHLISRHNHVGFLTPCQCQRTPYLRCLCTIKELHDQTTVRNTDLRQQPGFPPKSTPCFDRGRE